MAAAAVHVTGKGDASGARRALLPLATALGRCATRVPASTLLDIGESLVRVLGPVGSLERGQRTRRCLDYLARYFAAVGFAQGPSSRAAAIVSRNPYPPVYTTVSSQPGPLDKGRMIACNWARLAVTFGLRGGWPTKNLLSLPAPPVSSRDLEVFESYVREKDDAYALSAFARLGARGDAASL